MDILQILHLEFYCSDKTDYTLIFSEHVKTPPSLLDTLLTGTFDDLQDKFKENEDSSKRPQHHPESAQQPLDKRIKLTQPLSSSVLCKSKGRWTSKPKLSNQKKSIDDNQSLDLILRWKVNLEKCIDSSPLLISTGNFALFI